jgi:hypothetical protein
MFDAAPFDKLLFFPHTLMHKAQYLHSHGPVAI